MFLRGTCGLATLLLAVTFAVADWPQFRGPGGSGVSGATGLPVTWSKTENVRWKAALPGRGLSCPVIVGGRVYLTANSGSEQQRLHVLCFDEKTGKKLWERQAWATGNTGCHPKTCMAAPTPVTDGERVYALFATADLFCYDRDGNLQWYRSLVGDYPKLSNQVGMAASPVLYKDLLLVPMDNVGASFFAGIDRRTGQNRWKADRPRDINWTTPLVYTNRGRPEVLFQSGQGLYAYDPETGKKRWEFKPPAGSSSIPSPVAGDGTILAPGGGDFLVLRPPEEGGKPEVVWKSNKLRSGYASALYHQGKVYALTGANVLVCVDHASGKELWRERVTGPFAASPVLADGKVYAVSEGGKTSVVDVTGEPKVLAVNEIGETILATPAVSGGAIFLRSDQHLWCFGKK